MKASDATRCRRQERLSVPGARGEDDVVANLADKDLIRGELELLRQPHGLAALGKRHVTPDTIAALRRRLSDADRQQLFQDIRYSLAWIANVIRRVASAQGA